MDHPEEIRHHSLLVRETQRPIPAAGRALLAGGGIDPVFIERWVAGGRAFVIDDVAGDGPPLAAVLIMPVGGRTAEVRAVGVAAGREDVGERLLREVTLRLCREGHRTLRAPVPSADVARIGLLQRAGFRPAYVERDAATPEHGYTARDHRDLLWLELAL